MLNAKDQSSLGPLNSLTLRPALITQTFNALVLLYGSNTVLDGTSVTQFVKNRENFLRS